MYKVSHLKEQAGIQLLEDLQLNPNYLTEVWEEEEEEEEEEWEEEEEEEEEEWEELPPLTYTAEQFDALTAENAKMRGHMDTLLGETKTAKALAKQQADDAAQLANDKAKKDGDFEQLYNSSTEQANGYKSELETLRGSISKSNTNREAMNLAVQLADGYNAELLSEKIALRLKYTEEGVKVLDANGQLTVSTIDDLKTEFSNNERYASLLKGNQSSGGGAVGGKNSSAGGKLLTRAEFEKMNPSTKMEFIKSDGKITN